MANMAISDFVGKFAGGGARPNRFKCIMKNSNIGAAFSFLCKASSIPTFTLGKAPADFMGRKLYLAGDKEWNDWNVTVYNDTDWKIREGFEKWQNSLLAFVDNTSRATLSAETNSSNFYSDGEVQQLGRDGSVIASYNCRYMFPTEIGEITLDWGENDSIETFQVTFAINEWTLGITGGSAGPGE